MFNNIFFFTVYSTTAVKKIRSVRLVTPSTGAQAEPIPSTTSKRKRVGEAADESRRYAVVVEPEGEEIERLVSACPESPIARE